MSMGVPNILSAIPGSGKTRWMIEYMNEQPKNVKFIYVTPFKDETERIKKECKKRKFEVPDPDKGYGRKMIHFKKLIKEGANISTTHKLFEAIDDEVIKSIRDGNYILVLDEVMGVVGDLEIYADNDEKERILKEDMDFYIDKGCIEVDQEYKVNLVDGEKLPHLYQTLQRAIEKDQIYYVAEKCLLWTFPHQVFKDTFKEIFVLTYQFNYQIQAYYFKYYDIPYEQFGIIKSQKDRRCNPTFEKVSYEEYLEWERGERLKLKELIDIYDSNSSNSLNSFGNIQGGLKLSSTGYKKVLSPKDLTFIRKKATSYASYYLKDHSSTMMWTTYKSSRDKIACKKIPDKHFVPLNARASNEFRDKTGLIYLIDRYSMSYFKLLFAQKSIKVDDDGFALSEMIQWIFRSAIRDGEPIDIFIPSERMRTLLKKWLDGEY